MPMYDCQCNLCLEYTERFISIRERSTWNEQCLCGGIVSRTKSIINAPSVHFDANDYDSQIKKMKRSSKERFVKSGEMDSVRHKFGSSFDEGLVGAANDRIRNGTTEND